jgi:hypothetical protein
VITVCEMLRYRSESHLVAVTTTMRAVFRGAAECH